MNQSVNELDSGDFSILFLYFVAVLVTGFWSTFKTKGRGTVDGYFLAGRYMSWITIGASIFASNIGSEHLIGQAGSGAASGIGVAAFELNALIILQITGWIFLPIFLASKVCTLPEFLSKRFGGKRLRTYLAILSLALYIFTKISVNLFSGAIFIQQALGWNILVSVILLLVITAISTIIGGLAAVMYTDTVQTLIMIVGGLFVYWKSVDKIGGLQNLRSLYFNATISSAPSAEAFQCSRPKNTSFVLLRPFNDPDMPWLGFILGQTASSMWYWCTDQIIVQRLLASKNLSHAQGGTLFAGFLKLMPLFLIIIPGMISRILYTDEIACIDPDVCEKICQNRVGCWNIAYPKLVLTLMPSGLRGLMIASMLAALMSGLSSIFNGCSTMFTMDIWPLIRKKSTLKEQMIVSRIFVVIMIFISIAWIYVIKELQSGELYIYIQSISSILAPPIAMVYLLSILWRRMNEPAAFWTLIIGLLMGSIRLILELVYKAPSCGQDDNRPNILFLRIHYMYFAVFLSIISLITATVISLITKPPEKFRLIRSTYWTRFDHTPRDDEMKASNWTNEQREKIKLTSLQPETAIQSEVVAVYAKKSKLAKHELIMKKTKTFFTWLCGCDDTGDCELQKNVEAHDTKLSSQLLEQSKCEKIILRIFLVIIITLAIIIFTYFSLPIHLRGENE